MISSPLDLCRHQPPIATSGKQLPQPPSHIHIQGGKAEIDLFEFSAVAEKVGNLNPERLKVSKREVVVVHWLQHIVCVNRLQSWRFSTWSEPRANIYTFKAPPLIRKVAAQAKLFLGMFPSNAYTLVEDKGTLKLGWKDLCLLTASAWRP
ncbi:hypothetical protein L2E82_40701 [Cichorium intybus]|uniref:Uncharacterized protein n=1 Tax=Cichorium intybus TaxID=13427 RepID=A0ACB9AR40_CICIN|nr:hypothetical protein L2E82_40701 [Cichorium intybus]